MLSDAFKRLNFLIWWILLPAFIFLFPSSSFAAVGEICGDGIDNDSSGGDAACTTTDPDRDGYTTTDCDNTNRYIYPGISITAGCSAGQFRTCQSDGTYTACANLSTFTCKSGSGSDYWLDVGTATCSASNSYASPSSYLCFSDTGMTNYHAPVAGDCFIFKTVGTYSTTWSGSTKQIYVSNKDGTSSDHIKIAVLPGTSWAEAGIGSGVKIAGAGTAAPIYIEDSSYWDVTGVEVTRSSGSQDSGIWWNGGDHGHGWNLAVHGVSATNGNGNPAGLRANSHASWTIDHFLAYDNYPLTDATNQNNADVLFMDVSDVNIQYGVVYSTANAEIGIKGKHVGTGTTAAYIKNNVVFNEYQEGITFGGYSNITVANNYLEENMRANSGAGMTIMTTGTTPVSNAYQDIVIEYNTIINSGCFEVRPEDDATQLGSPFATFRKNVCVDNRATSYPADGTDGFIRIFHYGSDAVYNEFITGGTLTIDHNGYYNSIGTAIYETVFGDNSSTSNGTTYSTCSSMVTGSGTIAHTGSACENPSLNADGIATSTNTRDWGWAQTSSTTTTTTTTTGSSTSTTSIAGIGGALSGVY